MRVHYLAMAAIVAGLIIGCGGDKTSGENGTSNSAEGKKLKFAVIPKGTTHEFWKSIHAGAEDAAKELGVEIAWKGPQKEDDREQQQTVVESFVQEGVNGIVLAPLDDKALVKPVEEAVSSNIPVVIIDSDLQTDKYASFVATDNYKGGQIAGEEVIKLLGGKGDVIMMRYQEGSASTMNREKGFVDALKKAPGIKLVSDNQYGGATTETALKCGENLIAAFKNADGSLKAQAIYCPNESTTFGMLRALQDNKLAGKVKFVGFDSSEKLIIALGKGEINGLVVQNPYKMGYEGVKTLYNAIKGEKVEKKVDTGATLATKENMETEDIKKLLNPKKI